MTRKRNAQYDLKQVARLSRIMVLEWEMSERFQHISFGSEEEEVFLGHDMIRQRQYSDSTARESDEELQKITREAFDRALNTLKKNREVLDKVAEMLLEEEEIPGEEVDKLLRSKIAHSQNGNKDSG